jgi:predicted cupin superfamily sugar epimerase
MSNPSLVGQPASTSSRADFLIKTLGLTYLPKESGYIGILGRSCHNVTVEQQPTSHKPEEAAVIPSLPYSSEPVAAQSHNYYMLTSDHPINYLHFLAPDDTHILIEGGPVEYYIFTPPGHPSLVTRTPQPSSALASGRSPTASKTILGRDYLAGQVPIISVPGGCWKALRLCEGVEYALTANVLAPEFTEDRVKIGAGQRFVDMFKGRAEWATEEFLQTLIGAENWTGET